MLDDLTKQTGRLSDLDMQVNWCLQKMKEQILKRDAYALFVESWPTAPKSKKTFTRRWEMALPRYAEYRELEDKALNDLSLAGAIEGAKLGLKSKLQRQLERQRIIDDTLNKINGKTQHYYLTPKGAMAKTIQDNGTVMIPSHVLKDLNFILHIHQSALEKTSGDIVNKNAMTDPSGENAAPLPEVPPLTDEQVDKILSHFKAS